MMKVFLVDDEIAIRENLRNSFPWEESGFQLVGEGNHVELAAIEHAVGEFGNVGVHASLFAQDAHELPATGFALGAEKSFEQTVATVVELDGF